MKNNNVYIMIGCVVTAIVMSYFSKKMQEKNKAIEEQLMDRVDEFAKSCLPSSDDIFNELIKGKA